MMLDAEIKSQLSQYLQLMEGEVHIKLSVGTDNISIDMAALVDEFATMSPNIKVEKTTLERTPSFSLKLSWRRYRCYLCWYPSWTRIHFKFLLITSTVALRK